MLPIVLIALLGPLAVGALIVVAVMMGGLARDARPVEPTTWPTAAGRLTGERINEQRGGSYSGGVTVIAYRIRCLVGRLR